METIDITKNAKVIGKFYPEPSLKCYYPECKENHHNQGLHDAEGFFLCSKHFIEAVRKVVDEIYMSEAR